MSGSCEGRNMKLVRAIMWGGGVFLNSAPIREVQCLLIMKSVINTILGTIGACGISLIVTFLDASYIAMP